MDEMSPAEYARWEHAWMEYADITAQTRGMDPGTLTGYIATLRDIRALPEAAR